jgi:NhaA family Na+:H+ antiporter
VRPFQEFANRASSSGILLIAAAIVALVWANSPWAESYTGLWGTKLSIGLGSFSIEKDLTHWINDGLMAVFFLVVGLEIKREILVGELSSPRRAALPLAAAVGGAVLPAAIYLVLTFGTEGVSGWGIPMATDIAFALGVLALLGERVPIGLKVFMTALAIVDDILAVMVIALFYTSDVSWSARRCRVPCRAHRDQSRGSGQATVLRVAGDWAVALFPAVRGARDHSWGALGDDRPGQFLYRHRGVRPAEQGPPGSL